MAERAERLTGYFIRCIHIYRRLHGTGRSDVVEGDAGTGRRRGEAAPIHDNRLRDERPQGEVGDWHLPEAVAQFQATAQHRLLRLPDLSAEHPHRHAQLGQLLDQSRGDQRSRRSR